MIKYNLNKLIKINVFGFTKDFDWAWQEEKIIFGIRIRKEGFVCRWDSITGEGPRQYNYFGDNYSISNKEVFIKPHVSLYFQDEFVTCSYFNKKSEAIKYANEIAEESNGVFVEIK